MSLDLNYLLHAPWVLSPCLSIVGVWICVCLKAVWWTCLSLCVCMSAIMCACFSVCVYVCVFTVLRWNFLLLQFQISLLETELLLSSLLEHLSFVITNVASCSHSLSFYVCIISAFFTHSSCYISLSISLCFHPLCLSWHFGNVSWSSCQLPLLPSTLRSWLHLWAFSVLF